MTYATHCVPAAIGAHLSRFAFATRWNAVLRGDERAELLTGARVTSGFFSTTGVRPLLGRAFTAADSAEGHADIVMLGALGAGKAMRVVLVDVSAGDSLTLAAIVGSMMVVAVVAAVGPARRAATVDPMVALRNE